MASTIVARCLVPLQAFTLRYLGVGHLTAECHPKHGTRLLDVRITARFAPPTSRNCKGYPQRPLSVDQYATTTSDSTPNSTITPTVPCAFHQRARPHQAPPAKDLTLIMQT
ncbi:hypothetical protein Zmor_004463 [Zophobas morio]|uniref:Uncharacterized protein n=1 Tax=Zophobas morio TaxID=2755281 RepID=A0AA38LZP1_9CUCU|nr:hypothetical protein Zmor_004463 [Zophobas morio]